MASLSIIRAVSRNCNSNLLKPVRWSAVLGVPKTGTILSQPINRSDNLFQVQAKSFSLSPVKRAAAGIEEAGHNHVIHWTAERILSVGLLASIPAAIMFPCPALEYFLALNMTIHSHWGIEALIVDYVRPNMFGSLIPKVGIASVYLLSFLTLGGLFYFIYTDVGLVTAVKMLWRI